MFYDSLVLNAGNEYLVSKDDRSILRDLASRIRQINQDSTISTRKQRWTEHNSLRSSYPLMLVFPEGSWRELILPEDLLCRDESSREIELNLRKRLYAHQHFQDDTVLDERWVVRKVIHHSGWGVEAHWTRSQEVAGAKGFDPIFKTPEDLSRLRVPEIIYQERISQTAYQQMGDLFGDLLDVSLEGVKHISFHLMEQYSAWRGLEEVLMDFYLNPGMLHEAMSILEEGHQEIIRQYHESGLLSLNNDNTYQGTGGNGFTDQLPSKDVDPDHIQPADMWASAEAQELAQVSPEHLAEFVLPYEKRLLENFGLTAYGCCEDLTQKLDHLFTIPNLRRISISPWADVESCAEKLGDKFIFSWKPNPAHLVGIFKPEAIRDYIRHTVKVARDSGCILEIILKDTHTVENQPVRIDRWTKIAREVIKELWGDPPPVPRTS